MNEGKKVGIGCAHCVGGAATLRKVPTCEMAGAPGIFVAMTAARRRVISSACAACHVALPSSTAIATASAVMQRKLARAFQVFCARWRIGAVFQVRPGLAPASPINGMEPDLLGARLDSE